MHPFEDVFPIEDGDFSHCYVTLVYQRVNTPSISCFIVFLLLQLGVSMGIYRAIQWSYPFMPSAETPEIQPLIKGLLNIMNL